MANRSAKRFFFTLVGNQRFRLLQLSVADLFVDSDQFLYQLTKTPIFSDLRSGTIYRWPLGDDLGEGLSLVGMSQ